MANAKKCDRCKKCFDPFNMDGKLCTFRNPMFKGTTNFKKGTIGDLMFPINPDDYLDLCPDCAKEFRLFMQGWNVTYKLNDGENIDDVMATFRKQFEASLKEDDNIMQSAGINKEEE